MSKIILNRLESRCVYGLFPLQAPETTSLLRFLASRGHILLLLWLLSYLPARRVMPSDHPLSSLNQNSALSTSVLCLQLPCFLVLRIVTLHWATQAAQDNQLISTSIGPSMDTWVVVIRYQLWWEEVTLFSPSLSILRQCEMLYYLVPYKDNLVSPWEF